ncbi:MAG: hypothetical protein AAGC57_17685 [Pseudomonadota bacterium]
MIANLVADQWTVAALADVAEKNGDLLTQNMAIRRGQVHETFGRLIGAHFN